MDLFLRPPRWWAVSDCILFDLVVKPPTQPQETPSTVAEELLPGSHVHYLSYFIFYNP